MFTSVGILPIISVLIPMDYLVALGLEEIQQVKAVFSIKISLQMMRLQYLPFWGTEKLWIIARGSVYQLGRLAKLPIDLCIAEWKQQRMVIRVSSHIVALFDHPLQ